MENIKSFAVSVGGDRSLLVYVHGAELYCVANGLCSAFLMSDGSFWVSPFVSLLFFWTRKQH